MAAPAASATGASEVQNASARTAAVASTSKTIRAAIGPRMVRLADNRSAIQIRPMR
jgi:hypothetical protein